MKRLKRRLKGLLYSIGVHRLLPVRVLEYMADLGKASKWLNSQTDVPFSTFPTRNIVLANRFKLYEYLVDSENLKSAPVDYLEFGVYAAASFKWWVANLDDEDCRLYGFDTFTGLPEA